MLPYREAHISPHSVRDCRSEPSLQLPDDVLTRLQSEARRQHVPLDDLVRAAIEAHLKEEEPTKEAILESLRQAMGDALAGRVRPACVVLAELRREIEDNDGSS